MGISYEYDTTVETMIRQLKRIGRKYGMDTKLTLRNPNFYDPNFEGRNSCLTAIFSGDTNHAIIVEKDYK